MAEKTNFGMMGCGGNHEFRKIEQAYTYLLENTQSIQNELSTNFYDALIEQNVMYLDGKTDLDIVKNNSKKLKN